MLSIQFVVVIFGRSTCLIVYMFVTHIDDLVGGACVLQLVLVTRMSVLWNIIRMCSSNYAQSGVL